MYGCIYVSMYECMCNMLEMWLKIPYRLDKKIIMDIFVNTTMCMRLFGSTKFNIMFVMYICFLILKE